ncbi:glycosyltransferase [Vibrio pectenicida]|uniref:Glycosyltransferase n=1 Tax=Vibrio pectenicida TaxID=62763 RepID=A0A427TSD3_9VIBR|nr:glycosyltransferase [Vibrio pectenicida]NOH72655.1 glycosyltransferase [Vibrio pectenicida]RSD27282.1 glycosyltransferase [Vibrio pectenicida]
MSIDIVVPVFNQFEKTKLFINSLSRQIPYRLIIIDNGSDTETQKYINSIGAEVITNRKNLGYTKAMNQGLSICTSEYVLFSNNDVIMPNGLLSKLKSHLEYYDIVTPLSNLDPNDCENKDNSLLVAFDPNKDDIQSFSDALYRENKGARTPISMAYGHCILMKREVLEKVGLLDETFESGYHTDDDFCYRAIQCGFDIGLALDSFIFHFCHSTFKSLGIDSKKEIELSKQLFGEKYQ